MSSIRLGWILWSGRKKWTILFSITKGKGVIFFKMNELGTEHRVIGFRKNSLMVNLQMSFEDITD